MIHERVKAGLARARAKGRAWGGRRSRRTRVGSLQRSAVVLASGRQPSNSASARRRCSGSSPSRWLRERRLALLVRSASGMEECVMGMQIGKNQGT
jgi:DNA invertase Pin-like site-specific DNA recombinase